MSNEVSDLHSNELDALVLADIVAASSGEEPAAEAPVEGAKVEAAPDPAPAQAEAKVEEVAKPAEPPAPQKEEKVIKHRGKEVKLELTPELKDELITKGYDYTAKTMELADFRRHAESVITQVRSEQTAQAEAVAKLLQDPDKLEMIAAAIRQKNGSGASTPAAIPAPSPEGDDEFISKSQLTAYLAEAEKRLEAKVRAEAEKSKVTVKEDLELTSLTNHFAQDFSSHASNLVRTEFPVLSEFGPEDVVDKIREDAHKFVQAFTTLNPGIAIDPKQVKSVMTESAKKRADAIEGKLREREKKDALSKASLVQKGPEPRGGGAAPAPSGSKPLKLNDPSLEAQVLAEIQSIMGKGA